MSHGVELTVMSYSTVGNTGLKGEGVIKRLDRNCKLIMPKSSSFRKFNPIEFSSLRLWDLNQRIFFRSFCHCSQQC